MYYHVTPIENLQAILERGLEPDIGPRSAELGEVPARVYLFTNQEACETALCNWLGDAFEDVADGNLVILQIDPMGIKGVSEAGYELACADVIPAQNITRVLDEQFNPIPGLGQKEASGLRPGY